MEMFYFNKRLYSFIKMLKLCKIVFEEKEEWKLFLVVGDIDIIRNLVIIWL